MEDPTAPTPETTPEKTFTQVELDALLASERKKYPSDEELSAYRAWKKSQKAERGALEAMTQERDESKTALAAAQEELEQLKREKYVLSKGLTGEDAEFIAFKAAKMVNDKTTFEQAVDALIASRQNTPTFDWTAPVGSGTKPSTTNDAMNALLRDAFR